MTPHWRRTPPIGGRGLILAYHRVSDAAFDPLLLSVTSAHLAEHMRVLQAHTHVVSLEQMMTGPAGRRPLVALTFDDGYADNIGHLRAILERFDASATLFPVVSACEGDHHFWWDVLSWALLIGSCDVEELDLRRFGPNLAWRLEPASPQLRSDLASWTVLSPRESDLRCTAFRQIHKVLRESTSRKRDELIEHLLAELGYSSAPSAVSRSLTTEELAATAGHGVFAVGSHSMTHSALAPLTRAEQASEIAGSKAWLERVLQKPVAHFSYPFGTGTEVSRVTRSLVRRAGYEAAVANFEGMVDERSRRYGLPRILVRDLDGAAFEEMLLRQMSRGFG